jgi:ABC-2 type transport system permease protein
MAKKSMEKPAQGHSDQEHQAIAVSSHGAATQNTLPNIRLIIGREYKNRLTQRSFIITSIILLVIVFIAPFIPTIVQLVQSRTAGTPSQTQVVVVDNAGTVAGMNGTALLAYIGSQLNGTNTPSSAPYSITSQPPISQDSLQSQVKHGTLDILLVLKRSAQGNLQFVYDADVDPTSDSNLISIQALAQQLTVLDTAQRLGLTPSQTARLFAPASLTTTYPHQSQSTRPVSQVVAEYLLAFAGAILIYISIGIYGAIIAAGVAEEKSNRIMELLVNAATPFQLLAGKILGIGAACLTQMGGVVVVGISAILLQSPLQATLFGASAGSFSQYLTKVSIQFFLLFLVYILLAFFLYAALYAGLSAMVKRQDEVQNATILPTLLLVSGYLLFFLVAASPDATWAKVLSYFPFWTPTLMLVRIARGTVAWWEIVVTIGWMLVAILACTWFAARLYRLGVLMYGQRPGLSQLLKLVRMN